MLIQSTTMALVWIFDKAVEDFVLGQQVGMGQIGFSWNGAECVTDEQKPPKPQPQPVTQGTQTV